MSAVVALNEETRRMEQFNDIVANIKPLMTVGKGKNQRAVTGSTVGLDLGQTVNRIYPRRYLQYNYLYTLKPS